VDQLALPVDVRPAQRRQFPEPQAGEGGGEVEGPILVALGGGGELANLIGSQHVDVTGAALGHLLDTGGGVGPQGPDLYRPPEDAVDHGQPLVDRARR
jgi:hypothetical protein